MVVDTRAKRAIYLRPSTSHAWKVCAGYAALMAAFAGLLGLSEPLPPEPGDNEVREDGTAAHWLAHELWMGKTHIVGELSPNKRELTDEMFAGVEEYHQYLRSLPESPMLEQTLPVGSIFRGVQDGTPDAWCVSGVTLYLPDFKFGFRPVEVWRNPQLIIYAWTLLMLHPHVTDVELCIVQPRCTHVHGTVRVWATTREELRPLAEALQQAANAAMAEDPLCVVSDACRDCAAASACRAKQAAGFAGAEVAYDAQPHVLTPIQLGYELAKLQAAAKHIEHRITGLTTQAESILHARQRVPGYELGRAGTRWRWRDPYHVITLGKFLGVDVHAPPKLKTVAQLRDSFPGLDVQAMFAEKPVGENRLKQSDPNEAIRAFTQRKLK